MTTPDAPQPPDDEGSEATTPTNSSEGPPPRDEYPPGDITSPPHDPPPPQDEPTPHDTTSPPHDPPPPHGRPPRREPPPGGSGAAPPPPHRARTLDRRSTNRVVAGVAGGLGDYFNVDPAIFRLGFIVLAVFGGSGFLLYLVGWLFLPDRDTQRSVGEGLVRRLGGGRSAGGLILLFVALLVVADTLGDGGGLIWAALLIAIGVLLFRQADESDDNDSSSGPVDRSPISMWSEAPQTPPPAVPSSRPGGDLTAPASTSVQSSVTSSTSLGSSISSPAADPYLPPPPPVTDDGWRPTPYTPSELATPPSVLGRVTVAAALILIGATALLDTLTGVDVALASYAALALTVIGAGLLVGARWGRARGLIALGGVTVLVLTMSSVAARLPSGGIEGGVGQRTYRPETVAQLQDSYRLGLGEMRIDLTALGLKPGQDVTVDASMAVGSLQVIVPDDVGVDAEATAQFGAVDLLDRTSEGTDASASLSEPGEEGSPTIALDLSSVMGEIEVHRASTNPGIHSTSPDPQPARPDTQQEQPAEVN